MDSSPREEIRTFARGVLAKLSELATKEARDVAEHLKDALAAAGKAWARADRFLKFVDAHAEIEAAWSTLKEHGAAVLAEIPPQAPSTYDKETLSAAQEAQARSIAMKCAIADLNRGRYALVEALTGSGGSAELNRLRRKVPAGSDRASEKLEAALRSAAKLVGDEPTTPPPANDDASARRGRPRKRVAN